MNVHFIFKLLFCVIREDSMELSKLCGVEMLFINMFGFDISQPLPWYDSNRTLHQPIMPLVY